MKPLVLALVLTLVGCATDEIAKEQPVAIKYKYVAPQVPEALLVIPPQVPNIDPEVATDRDAAQWLVDSEARARAIELQLKKVGDLLRKQLQDLKDKFKNDLVE